MASSSLQPEISSSLLDRLIDLDPESPREALVSSWEQVRDFRLALCRDLTAVLNTRRASEEVESSYPEAANSLLTFGILDFTAYNLKKGNEQEQLRRSVERAIRQFEPRLERVAVSLEDADPQRPVLRLQISAVLRTEAGEPLFFDAALQRDSRRFVVSGGV
jgi:type VI secretion system protein ImpF